MDKFLLPLLLASGAPSLIMLICLVTAILAFLRQTEIGSAGAVAGFGFGALAGASALKVLMLYTQFSGYANHASTTEIARAIGVMGLGSNLLEIAGLVLIAVAMFQRRPARPLL